MSMARATNVASQPMAIDSGCERVVDRAHRRALGLLAQRAGRRVLALGQAVNVVVEQDDVQVEVAANGVHQVVAADRQAVAVAGDDPHLQVGPGHLQTGRHGRGPAVDGVEAVGVHVIREAARTADARDEHDLFRAGCPASAALFSSGRGSSSRRSRGHQRIVLVAGEILRGQDRQGRGTHWRPSSIWSDRVDEFADEERLALDLVEAHRIDQEFSAQ